MASIGIIISQSGVPGTPGESREDLVVGSQVTFSNFSGLGITSYKWELIGKPYTSSVTLSSTSSSTVYFTPDVVGSYLIQLTINNKLKQRVVAAILTDRHSIRIPASGEGEEIPGGSFKAITESIRTLEEDSVNAAMIQGKNISLNNPGLNDFLRFNGEEWIPSGKVRSDDLGFRNTQNILVKIPLSAAIQANSYWEYNSEVGTIKPCWKTISSGGNLPILDFLWNSFPHGSVLKKVYVVASCENPSSNQLTIRVEKSGAIWSSDNIVSFVDQFVSTTQHTVSSSTGVTLSISENTEFTHGNSNDTVVASEELKIRLTADGTHTFRIFSIYAHFQTLSVGLYNGPLVAEGGIGEGQGDFGGGGCCPEPFDFVLEPTLLTNEQSGKYFFCMGSPFNGQITLPLLPTPGLQFTIMCEGDGITIDGNGSPMAGPMGLSWGAYVVGLETSSSVTLTAKDLDPFLPGTFAWVITGGMGEFFNNDDPTQRFNFNFQVPNTFPVDAGGIILGKNNFGIVDVGGTTYDIRRTRSQQHAGGTPVLVTSIPFAWRLVESGRSDFTGTSPVVCTFDTEFAMVNDDGWECTFMVGVDSALNPVPMTVKCASFVNELCIEEARYVNSITASSPGAFVRVKYIGSPVGHGKFQIIEGRGTWIDDLFVEHNLTGSGGSGHNPVTLNQSAITGGLSLNNQEISFRAADTTYDGYLKSSDWDIFNSKEPSQTKGSISETSSSVLIITNGSNSTVGPNVTIQAKKASASQDGYLGKDNWVTFNAKEPAQIKGSISETVSSIFTITNGFGSTVGPNVTIQAKKASASQDGYLGKDDFVAFSSGGHNPVTLNQSAITGGLSLNNQEISFRAANTTYDGYLKSSDWDTFNSKITDPMSVRGDIIYRNSSNITDRLPLGSDGYFLASDGMDLIWKQPNTSYVYQEFTSQTSVVVNHNLGAYPVVQIIGTNKEVFIPLSIVNTSVNSFIVSFSVATSGTILATLGTSAAITYPRKVVFSESAIDLIDGVDFTITEVENFVSVGVGYSIEVNPTTSTGNLTIILYQDIARLESVFTMVVDLSDAYYYRTSEAFGFNLETTGTLYGTVFVSGVPVSQTFDISIDSTPILSGNIPTPISSPYGAGIEDDGTGKARVALPSISGLQLSGGKLLVDPDITASVYPVLGVGGMSITGAVTTTTDEAISAKKVFDSVGCIPKVTPGSPISGTYNSGSLICDSYGVFWSCKNGGTPGTWELFSSVYETPNDAYTAYLTYGNSELLEIPVMGNVGTIQRLQIWGVVNTIDDYSIPFRARIYENSNELGRELVWQGNAYAKQTYLSGILNAATTTVPVNDNNIAEIDEPIIIFEDGSRYELGRVVSKSTGVFTIDEALVDVSSWAANTFVLVASEFINVPFVNTEANPSNQQKIYLQIRHDGLSTHPAVRFYVRATTHSIGIVR